MARNRHPSQKTPRHQGHSAICEGTIILQVDRINIFSGPSNEADQDMISDGIDQRKSDRGMVYCANCSQDMSITGGLSKRESIVQSIQMFQ